MTDRASASRRSPRRERALSAAIVAAKAATIGLALDALIHVNSPRLRGKAIRTRALGYTAGLFVVPIVWRMLPNRERYPRGLDLAVTIPLLLDAAGNALGLYEAAHIDDVVHFANAAIMSGVAGSLFAPHVDERWQAAVAGASVAVVGEVAWELAEFGAWKFLGADGMNLTYTDTMEDIAESWLGAAVGGLFTLTRLPRGTSDRRTVGWQGALGMRELQPAAGA
jgi:hypothetical protein